MGKRKGTLLEQHVESIFSSAGFDTHTNKFHSEYEIDVYASLGDIDVIAECKQYEKSNLSVRNLIHEWKGKNESIEADVVVLVIYGQEIKKKEEKLAEENNIEIWGEDDVERLLNKDEEETKDFIFSNLPIKDQELGEAYSTRINRLVWKSYLEGNDKINDDTAYEELLLMVKERIRRELLQKGSTKKVRRAHIEVFENVKKSGMIRSKIDVRSSHEKFNKIKKKLESNESPITESVENKYLKYLNSVENKLTEAKKFYLDSEGEKQIRRVTRARLKHLMRFGGGVSIAPRRQINEITIAKEGSNILFSFEIKKAGDLETIRWILTKEGRHDQQKKNNQTRHLVKFSYDDIKDATDAVIRIIDEYEDWDLDTVRIVDKNKDDLSRGQGLFSQLLN